MSVRAGSSISSPLAFGARRCGALPNKAIRSTPAAQATCQFTTTSPQRRRTKAQHDMYKWLRGRSAEQFRDATPTGPRYLGQAPDQPFPLNPYFRSQSVLSEDLRNEVYRRVKEQNHSMKAVSSDLGIDVRRVAAVVRMKEVEKQWVAQKKSLAKPYANAILGMLPQTPLDPNQKTPHESINEIHVHKLTMQQLFVPVSESRHFDREDAAKAFHRNMLSAEARSPLKELVKLRKDIANGVSPQEADKAFRETTRAEEDRLIAREQARLRKAEEETTRVDTGRFEFRFKEMNVEDAGKDGRGRKAVGWRYGVPFYDRRKGEFKLPTSVP
ncbi:hypothetical protein CMUS01_04088 [Colletotrichum musicola]|uniref:37S ribosomal protein S35 n=1 Tax=Colletotrichum musicola TaxID=2175873 RepID=A0A8H6NP93_9PEZI|nr:hypothetical protein CMUS01_04088 [Colletotrichum musicola]